MSVEARVHSLGLSIPKAPAPVSRYVNYKRVGNLLVLAGQVPVGEDGKPVFVGKVGAGVDEETGYRAARLCALNCLAQIRDAVGSLDRVKQVVAITGYVACVPSFTRLGAITNGASELLLEVFGDAGRHARTSLGVAVLANDVTAEIDMMVEVHPG